MSSFRKSFCVIAAMFLFFVYYTTPKKKAYWDIESELSKFNKVRDPIRYLNMYSSILPSNFCEKRPFLTIVVHSEPSSLEFRRAIRNTWGHSDRLRPLHTSMVFLLGETPDPRVQKQIVEESEAFDDIVQECFLDTPLNATIKSLMMLKLATIHCYHKRRFLLKTDDRTFVDVAKVTAVLKVRASSWLLLGHRHRRDKRLSYLSGGYLMSLPVARRLFRSALKTALYHMDDVFVTGICAKRANVRIRHNSLFSPRRLDVAGNECLLKRACLIDDLTVEDMLRLYSANCTRERIKSADVFSLIEVP